MKNLQKSKYENEELRNKKEETVQEIIDTENEITNYKLEINTAEQEIDEIQSQQYETFTYNKELYHILEARIKVLKETIIEKQYLIKCLKAKINKDTRNRYRTKQIILINTLKIRDIQLNLEKRK